MEEHVTDLRGSSWRSDSPPVATPPAESSGARAKHGTPHPAQARPGLPVPASVARTTGEGAAEAGRISQRTWTFLTDDGEVTYRIGENANLAYADADGVTIWLPNWSSREYAWDQVVAVADSDGDISPSDPRIREFTEGIGRGGQG